MRHAVLRVCRWEMLSWEMYGYDTYVVGGGEMG